MIDTSDAQGRLKNRAPIGIIDIGSNSVRLVIYEGLVRSPAILFNEKVSCGLGRGIAEKNLMDEGAVTQALAALRRYRALLEQAQVDQFHVLATAAAREADNGADFVERAEEILGQGIRILSGREEAMYSAFGVMAAFRAPDGLAGDLGGGSLELVDIQDDRFGEGVTLPLGCIRLQELAKENLEKAGKIAASDLKNEKLVIQGRGRPFYAVGGTWRNIAKLHMEAIDYPLHVTHGYEVATNEMIRFCRSLVGANMDEVKGIQTVSSSRRSLLPYGAAAMIELLKVMKPSCVQFSALGVREGLLFSLLDEETRARDGLIDAADELAILRSRSPRHARELADWTGEAFKLFKIDETVDEERYRQAACRLGDIGWRAHADYRATQSLAIIAYSSFVQIDHQGRAFLALANYFRYEGLKNESLAPAIRVLTSDRIWERAKLLGAFMRVAYLFTAAMPGVIKHLEWEETESGDIDLHVPMRLSGLIGERPIGRVNQLSKLTGRNITIVVDRDQ